MTNSADEAGTTTWPMPKFYFLVDFGDGVGVSFQEVTGLESETQMIEYRHGDSPLFSTVKMPGIQKFGNVTLKKGIFAKDADFLRWYAELRMNTSQRKTVVIKLLDQAGAATMTWTLANAWPTKITGTDLKADGNEIAVESVELAYERVDIANS